MMKYEKQLALYMDNRPGMLARTCKALAEANINILALSMLDTVDHAIVRMVVDKPKEAEKELSKMHSMIQSRDVIWMELPNQAGALAEIAQRLAAAGINLEYAYCTSAGPKNPTAVVLRTNDLEATVNALS